MRLFFQTPSASKRLEELMAAGGGPGKFFKLGLQKKGCNGKAFTLNVTQDAPSKFDEVVDINGNFCEMENSMGWHIALGMKIVIDKGALLQIIGTRMDYVTDELMQSEFVFENPNAKGVCGCGESFN
jgi:iron-sulfur cluster assembly 1